MHLYIKISIIAALSLYFTQCDSDVKFVDVEVKPNQVPVLRNDSINPIVRIKIDAEKNAKLKSILLDFSGSTDMDDLASVSLYSSGKDSVFKSSNRIAQTTDIRNELLIATNYKLNKTNEYLWVSVQLKDSVDLLNQLKISVKSIHLSKGTINLVKDIKSKFYRYGVALRKFGQDKVHTSRIPGLATSENGTLMAIYDARRDLGRDLQGDIDIGLNRSFDNGDTWEPMQVIIDMGEWGGLPQKFNGVSDANILVNGKDIYVAGLWMHGVIDKEGKWLEGLNEKSEDWNHQWRNKGSQAGFDPKQTSQFLIVKSTDNGATWSDPINLTKMCKKEEWWLWAPAPGRGIVLDDGTLIFPTQGRDRDGLPFSNITYSLDNGTTWQTSNPASHNTTECSVVELENGKLMLNVRDNRNRSDKSETNGRGIFATTNLGKSWQEHETSHNALIEPVCMASLHKHHYLSQGHRKHVLLFSNPNSKFHRINQTIKISHDNGNSWPKENWLLLDVGKGRGYSCITSIDDSTIGIIYEGSRAQIVYQKIDIGDFIEL